MDADVNAQNHAGIVALSRAAQAGHEEVVKALLKAGCTVDPEDEARETPLISAAIYNHAGIVKVLLEAGADRTLIDREEVHDEGMMALQHAEQLGNTQIVALLQK